MPRIVLIALSALLLAACDGPLDRSGLRSELLETDRAFAARSVEAGAARAFEEFLAEDALQLPDGQPPVEGRAAIVAALEDTGDGWVLAWEPQTARVGDGGRMGWTWGTWELRPAEAGDAEPRYGKYLNVWQRGRDGRWRVSVDMGNGSPAPPEDAAEPEPEPEPEPRKIPTDVTGSASEGVSDAELTPVYAEFGAALHDAQVLEFGLILLMALATRYDQAHFPEGPRESLSPARIGKTLGQLFFAVREKEYFTKAEKKMIFKAIRKRNDLIHGYMVDRVHDLLSAEGRQFLLEDIRRTRKALQDADRVNASLIDRYLKEYGTSLEEVEAQARAAMRQEDETEAD